MSENKNINETIGLDEAVKYCSNYLMGNISEEDFKIWADTIRFRTYIPLEEKNEIINLLISKAIQYDLNYISLFSIDLEIDKFFYAFLKYTNISLEDHEDLITSDTYDILQSTLGKILLVFVKEDYEQMISLYNETMNYKNIVKLMDRFNVLDTKAVKSQDKTLNNLLKLIESPEIVDKVTKILTINNL